MLIRQENVNDYIEIDNLVMLAFKTTEHSDGNEHNLVKLLRKSKSFIPGLSLVAVKDSKIVGYILFTEVSVCNSKELALAPLAVLPECWHQGIGLALIERGHTIARNLNYNYSIVLGDPNYYSKSGYVPASIYGIRPPFDVNDKNFMAIKLNDKAKNLDGVVSYAKEFNIG